MATHADLHLLAHTARMLAVLRDAPNHPRGAEYVAQLGAYRARWAQLSPDERAEIVEVAHELHDMDAERIAAALEVLTSQEV